MAKGMLTPATFRTIFCKYLKICLMNRIPVTVFGSYNNIVNIKHETLKMLRHIKTFEVFFASSSLISQGRGYLGSDPVNGITLHLIAPKRRALMQFHL